MIKSIPNADCIKKTDFDRVRRAVVCIKQEINSGRWDSRKKFDDIMNIDVFSMNQYGSVSTTSALDGSPWLFWMGAWLETLLPWAEEIRQKFLQVGLPISTITYHEHTFSVSGHKDVAYLGEDAHLPHTNVNYVISSAYPDTSYTWCKDEDGQEMRYYSHPGRLWLINASNLHGIESQGSREALIIKFRAPFAQLDQFFQDHPDFFNAD